MKRALLLGAVMVAWAACSAMSGPTLDGTEWLSVARTDGGEDRPLVDGTRVRLRFDDGSVTAAAGCNTLGGTYSLESDRLVVIEMATTEIGCNGELHAQDEWLGGLLGMRPAIAVDGAKLSLTAGDEVVTFESAEVAEPDLPLTETVWTVDSLISGDAVSNVPGGAVATIAFRDDGTVEVDTGCNTGGGTYELHGRTLRTRELLTKLVGCPDPTGLERTMLGVLNGSEIDVAIDGDRLTLSAGDQGLGLRGR